MPRVQVRAVPSQPLLLIFLQMKALATNKPFTNTHVMKLRRQTLVLRASCKAREADSGRRTSKTSSCFSLLVVRLPSEFVAGITAFTAPATHAAAHAGDVWSTWQHPIGPGLSSSARQRALLTFLILPQGARVSAVCSIRVSQFSECSTYRRKPQITQATKSIRAISLGCSASSDHQHVTRRRCAGRSKAQSWPRKYKYGLNCRLTTFRNS